MIREIVRPLQNDLHIYIPTKYLNKDVEVIIFPLDEQENITKVEKLEQEKSLRGVFNAYADEKKISLEESAWQLSVKNKFSKND